ncbi:RRF domain containing protein [Asbolus verrucosus]|uniref:Ribosome-recycling factor, mitochondrial n=1 Tax=Asbolus verrucosus TaxID=1661398 RepID=A0A482VH14_ASBVE|nr:RRF domain containing protein [Asbolus verrucosus]
MFASRILSRNKRHVRAYKNCVYLLPNYSNHTRNLSTFKPLVVNLWNKNNPQLLISTRNYAKSKDKGKDKEYLGKPSKAKVTVNENQLAEVINVESLKNQMQKAIDSLKDDFVKHLSVRSSADSIEGILVEFNGKEHKLQELAQIVRKTPKLLL